MSLLSLSNGRIGSTLMVIQRRKIRREAGLVL